MAQNLFLGMEVLRLRVGAHQVIYSSTNSPALCGGGQDAGWPLTQARGGCIGSTKQCFALRVFYCK